MINKQNKIDGEKLDFDSLWIKYEKELTNFVNSRVYDKSLVNDIMQEVAIKIYKNINSLSNIENIRAWLYRLTRNILIDFYRQKDKTIPEELYNLDSTYTKDNFEDKELSRCLNKISLGLKLSDKKILDLSIYEQYSVKEIAKEFNLSIEGAKSKLKRAKLKLSKEFFSCCSLEKDTRENIITYKCLDNKKCDC